MLRFDRIQHLISPAELENKLVVQVGVGSGGAAVNDHLTMNGVRRWTLFDPDSYDEVNLVKHPRTRLGLGRLKVKNQEEWILDRNPKAKIVLWAHNSHVSAGGFKFESMGTTLRRMYGQDMVVLGFAFNQGSFRSMSENGGGLKDFTVAPLPPGSLDATLASAGIPLFALVLAFNGISMGW